MFGVCYAAPSRRLAFASRAPNFQGFIYDLTVGSSEFNFFEIYTAITISTNNRITQLVIKLLVIKPGVHWRLVCRFCSTQLSQTVLDG